MKRMCPACQEYGIPRQMLDLEAALQSIKDDYEFCQANIASGRLDRSEAYYETACKALTKDET